MLKMKYILLVSVVVHAVFVQHCFCQCIRTSAIGVPSTVAVTPSVANSLADTLALLTVSSLLSEILPLNQNMIATIPVPVAPVAAPVVSGCGCRGLACPDLGCGNVACAALPCGNVGCGGRVCGGLGCGNLGYGYNYLY